MNGRLRLDKLSNSIESFLSTKVNNNNTNDRNVDESLDSPKIDSSSDEMNHQQRHHQQQQINSNSPSSPLWNDIEPTGPLYYKVDNKTPESRVWDDEKSIQEIKTAVPFCHELFYVDSVVVLNSYIFHLITGIACTTGR
jgi:hypothetical protein